MSFASTAFAEQPFAADSFVFTVDISPVYYFNNKVLTFEMSVNFLSEFSVYYSKDFDMSLNINTLIDVSQNLNFENSYDLNINTTIENELFR